VRLLLDTCLLAELRLTEGSPRVKAFVAAMPSNALFLSVITMGEVAKGIALLADGRKKQALETWQVDLSRQFEERILPVDQETAELWGELTAAGKKKGFVIPTEDGLIAATALRHGLHVATRNTPHFEQAGAMVANPWAA
jgi:predicted nucleic acid-binding protein